MESINHENGLELKEIGPPLEESKFINLNSSQVYHIELCGLEQSQKYTIRVNTVIDGKIIARRTENIEAVLLHDGQVAK